MMGLLHKPFTRYLHNGSRMVVVPAEHIQQQIFWYGYYEKEAVLTWEAFLTGQPVVLDIGANTGYYSLVAAPLAREVYSFEPSTHTRRQLESNIRLNGMRNVHPQAIALSDHSGFAGFYISKPDNTGMSGLLPAENFTGSVETVRTARLDEWIAENNIQDVHCIKIDVEGAELKVLNGGSRLIASSRPAIFMEVIEDQLRRYGAGKEDVFEFFRSRHYRAYEMIAPLRVRRVDQAAEGYTMLFVPDEAGVPAAVTVLERS